MAKTVIVIEKFCDWLDAYSVFVDFPNEEILIHFLENERNDMKSISSLFNEIVLNLNLKVFGHSSKSYFINDLPREIVKSLNDGDIVAMPFVRYISIWKTLAKVPKGVTTIHMSEGLPETFGQIGYRIGFRGKNLKTYLSLPYAKIYSMMNKADICYFPAFPYYNNPFAKKTRKMHIPPLLASKEKVLNELLDDNKRPLIIGGFGYDAYKMAKKLGIKKYIATSKAIEIIIDGEVYHLDERISAEEVLLSRKVVEVISYTSNVVVWAKLISPNIPIKCFAATGLNDFMGPFYGWYAKRALKKFGIKVCPEDQDMLS